MSNVTIFTKLVEANCELSDRKYIRVDDVINASNSRRTDTFIQPLKVPNHRPPHLDKLLQEWLHRPVQVPHLKDWRFPVMHEFGTVSVPSLTYVSAVVASTLHIDRKNEMSKERKQAIVIAAIAVMGISIGVVLFSHQGTSKSNKLEGFSNMVRKKQAAS